MSDVKLGQLIDGDAERDCIHVALAPVVASENLAPGAHVGLTPEGLAGLTGGVLKPIGIVDPFLKHAVPKGHKFWLVLYQNTVTGMRHHWNHPAFGATDFDSAVDESRRWLRAFASEWGMDFDEMFNAAVNPKGNYICAGTDLNGPEELGRDHERFWQHMEIVTGRKFTVEHQDEVQWRCAC